MFSFDVMRRLVLLRIGLGENLLVSVLIFDADFTSEMIGVVFMLQCVFSPDADLIFEMKGWLVFWWVISPQTQIPQIIPQIRPSAEPLPMVAATQIK